ncbi:hypothetical protein DFH06DRAFT_699814 [Mycena polygramma]|nr:hypothetical protein DFH06DRAFT_699814 [Mycena polygramma]
MPYSDPGVVVSPPPQAQQARPGHRRSYTFAADDPRAGPGAFASLGLLPRRTRSHVASPSPSSTSQSTSSQPSGTGTSNARKFHFRGDVDNDDSSSSSDEPASSALHGQDDDDGPPPPLRLRQPPAFRLTPATGGSGFHRASPPRSPQRSPNSSSVNVPSSLNVNTNTLSAPGPVPFPRSSPGPGSSSPLSPTFADAVAYNTSLGGSGNAFNPNYPASYASGGGNGGNPKRPAGPARTSSTPLILLSNGKPLKSSLKSSSSAPQMPSHHLRARSAPSTPCLAGVEVNPTSPEAESPGTPTSKAVHFPAPDAGLEDIRLFKRSARPASVSFPLDEETETETEGENSNSGTNVRWSGGVFAGGSNNSDRGYPFPKVVRSPLNPMTRTTGVGARHPHPHHTAQHHSMLSPMSSPSLHPPHSSRSHSAHGKQEEEGLAWRYALHAPGIPRVVSQETEGGCMVVLEGLGFADPPSSTATTENELTLHGTLLARNAAFEKHVFVRFTLDGWCTTSEVGARWVGSASAADSPFGAGWGSNSSPSHLNGEQVGGKQGGGEQGGKEQGGKEEPGPGWDRFAFSIRLTDYAHSRVGGSSGDPRLRETGLGGIGRGLEGRELVLVGRFFAPWVRAGGVGPYRWCDTLSPTSTSPATQSGTDVSPSGRAWVGFGNGGQAGSGEWWDNNGGKDYRVGFRCVAVEEDTPVSTPTQAPTTTAPTVNAIPFPSAESPTTTTPTISLSASSAIPASALISPLALPQAMNGTQANGAPYPSPTQNGNNNGTTTPPPPPPRTAHAQALAAKLGRLNLRNYAAPRAVSLPGGVGAGAPVVAPAPAPLVSPLKVEPVEESAENIKEEKETSAEKEQKSQSEEATNEKEEEKKEEEKLQPAPGTQSSGGIGLYWPWGRVSAASPPTVVRSTAAPSASTPPTSPPSDDGDGDADSSSDDDDTASSLMSSSHILQSSSSSAETEMEAETPPTSPLGAGGLLPLIEGMMPPVIEGMPRFGGAGEDEVTPTNENGWKGKEAAKVPLPLSPPTLSPLSSGASTPRTSPPSTTSASPPPVSAPLLPSAADASSSLYKAFVRQWCFAGNGNGNGSASGGNGAKGVVGV